MSSRAGAFVSRQCASARARVTECNLRLSRRRIIAPAPHGDQLIRELFCQEGGPGEGGGGVAGMRRRRTMQLAAADQYCILRRGRPGGRGRQANCVPALAAGTSRDQDGTALCLLHFDLP